MHQRTVYFLLALLLAAPYVSASDNCSDWLAVAESIQGKVDSQNAGRSSWNPVYRGYHICYGDKIRISKHSRATLVFKSGESVDLEQNTTAHFPTKQKTHWLVNLLNGSAFIRLRSWQAFNIKTPFMNLRHVGTEFSVTVNSQQTETVVFDGQVTGTNQQGKIDITKGYKGIAAKNQAPFVKALRVRPKDAVQWSLYYPPIIDANSFKKPVFKTSLNAYRQGDSYQALILLEQTAPAKLDIDTLIYKSSLLLTLGSVNEAISLIGQAQKIEPNNSLALALQSIISVTKNRQDRAFSLAKKAVALDPQSATVQIALSYAYQSQFKISEALTATKEAVRLSPDNALAWARLAELQFSKGDRNGALKSARKAEILNPALGRTQTVLGFSYLAQIDIDKAKYAFTQAIILDSADPLARLGLGLAKIRTGEIEEGTRNIETAVSLDPDNAIMRSYLGKAYFELRNDDYAATELKIAKEMDANDPTPWFYDAIRKQTINRPIEALHDMEKAIEQNDNRGVYRSKLLLDEDLAARSASLGRIYNDLGFEQLGLLEGWKSQSSDPSNYSAHRLLADNYAGLPRHQVAKVSELLQSQLLQPLNITPIQPQLAESNLLIFDGLGPSRASFNEYNPMFARNRFSLQASGIIGSNETYGDEVVLSGLYDQFSYSLGQFHYQTDGYRENSDLETNIYNVFLQTKVSDSLNLQFEYRRENSESGDLRQLSNPDFLAKDLRQKLDRDSVRGGFNYEFSPNINLLGNFSYGEIDRVTNDPLFRPLSPIILDKLKTLPGTEILHPFLTSVLPKGLNAQDDFINRLENWNNELQLISQWDKLNLITGVSYIHQTRLRERIQSTQFSSQLDANLVSNLAAILPEQFEGLFGAPRAILAQALNDGLVDPIIEEQKIGGELDIDQERTKENHTVGYLYSIFQVFDKLALTFGASIDSIDRASSNGDRLSFSRTYINPKVGLLWKPFKNTTFRSAYFKSTKRPFASNQTIEPTQISGFNQFFDDPDYSRSTRYGFGFNQVISPNLSLGGEVSWRKVKIPNFLTGDLDKIQIISQNEETHRAYIYWTPQKYLAFSTEYFFESFKRKPKGSISVATPIKMSWHHVPMSLAYFSENGFFGKITSHYVNQNVALKTNGVGTSDQNYFWVFDTSLGYRLPKRWGILNLGIKNIFDNRFKFQDTNFNFIKSINEDFLSPQFVPERTIFGQLTVAF